MSYLQAFNIENPNFKPFKKDSHLLNNILLVINSTNKIFYILSSSRCRKKRISTLTINLDGSSLYDILNLELLLSNNTWIISDNTIKTAINGVLYSLPTLLTNYNININYSLTCNSNSNLYDKLFLLFPKWLQLYKT